MIDDTDRTRTTQWLLPTLCCASVGRATGADPLGSRDFQLQGTCLLDYSSDSIASPLEEMEAAQETGILATNLPILKNDNKCFPVLVRQRYYVMLIF